MNEAKLKINTLVLVPCWIQEVVSVSKSFYDEFLSDHEIKPLDAILNIEFADGKSLLYLRCVETNITEIEGIPEMASTSGLFLVTPDTNYSNKTPVLLGTNILDVLIDTCKIIHGERYLQCANLQTPWFLTLRDIVVREKELRKNKSRVYLDDIIIFAKDFEEHLERLDLVIIRLKECNLKLSAEKCFFMGKRVKFLGHVVSVFGIETDPDKIEKVKNWPVPKNAFFCNIAGYYRRYVQGFSKLAKQLNDFLPLTSTNRNKSKKTQKEWKWTEIEQEAFM